MKTVIIEDEPLVAKDLQHLIEQIDSSIEIIAVLNSLEKCIDYFTTNSQPDLIFMDIQLSDGVSFDLFSHVRLSCPIIFTTAYNEYAIRAFKVNSVDYLLKPIDKNELKAAIVKLNGFETYQAHMLKDQLQLLLNHFASPNQEKKYKERFTAHSGKSQVVIDYSQIAYFLKDTLIYIVTNDKQQFVTDFQTMEEIEELVDPIVFFRANRQYILNSNAVESFRSDVYGKMVVKLKDPLHATVDISREKAQAFKSWVQKEL